MKRWEFGETGKESVICQKKTMRDRMVGRSYNSNRRISLAQSDRKGMQWGCGGKTKEKEWRRRAVVVPHLCRGPLQRCLPHLHGFIDFHSLPLARRAAETINAASSMDLLSRSPPTVAGWLMEWRSIEGEVFYGFPWSFSVEKGSGDVKPCSPSGSSFW